MSAILRFKKLVIIMNQPPHLLASMWRFDRFDKQQPHNSDLQRRRPGLDTVDEMREMCFPSNHIGVIAVP